MPMTNNERRFLAIYLDSGTVCPIMHSVTNVSVWIALSYPVSILILLIVGSLGTTVKPDVSLQVNIKPLSNTCLIYWEFHTPMNCSTDSSRGVYGNGPQYHPLVTTVYTSGTIVPRVFAKAALPPNSFTLVM